MSEILPEEWRDVVGYEGYYKVSSHGRVKGLKRVIITSLNTKALIPERVLTPCEDGKGYYQLTLSKNGKNQNARVHTLVAKAFLPPCPGVHGCGCDEYTIDHINEVKTDNNASNLQWLLSKDNILKGNRPEKKISAKGESVESSVLTEQDILKIRKDYRPIDAIAIEYSVSSYCIYAIIYKETWKHLPYPDLEKQILFRKRRRAKGHQNGNAKLTEKDIVAIRNDSRSNTIIANDYKITKSTVSKIKKKQTWKHVA
jgi:hypothetical protein